MSFSSFLCSTSSRAKNMFFRVFWAICMAHLFSKNPSLLGTKRRWCSSAGRSTCAKRGPLKTSEHAAPAQTCRWHFTGSWGKKYPHWSLVGKKWKPYHTTTLSKNQLIVEGKHSSACFFQQGHHPLSFVTFWQAPKSSVSSTSSPCKRRNLAPRRDSTKPGPCWSPTSSRWMGDGSWELEKTCNIGTYLEDRAPGLVSG